MNAAAFNAFISEAVREVLGSSAWRLDGTTLISQAGETQVVVRRVELRYRPPARHLLLLRHTFLHDGGFDDTPAAVPRETYSYPVAIRPSAVADLLRDDWRYTSTNGTVVPDVFDYRSETAISARLYAMRLATLLAEYTDQLIQRFTPRRIVDELQKLEEPNWIEQRWLDDYRRHAGF